LLIEKGVVVEFMLGERVVSGMAVWNFRVLERVAAFFFCCKTKARLSLWESRAGCNALS
jgi:hypothetical protein